MISVTVIRTRKVINFDDLFDFNNWLISEGEDLWIKVRFTLVTSSTDSVARKDSTPTANSPNTPDFARYPHP